MRFLLQILLLAALLNHVSAQETTMHKEWVRLGEDSVALITYIKPGSNHVFVHVHENETTSLAAGLYMLEQMGGKLITIEHSITPEKNRYITFNHKKKRYRIDPNRIFTGDSSVLLNNLEMVKGRGNIPAEVSLIVQHLASCIWDKVKDHNIIIALHNNKNEPASCKRKWLFWTKYEPESYSILSYARTFGNSSDSNLSCSDIYLNPLYNNSDFFIVTQRQDFDMLLQVRCPVVLQNLNPVDDGSMSVFAAMNDIRYINSEAKHGNAQEQETLLNILLSTIYR